MAQKKKISEKTDKRRRAKVVVGHDAYGEPIIKYASGKTKAELEASKAELIKSYVGGVKVQRDVLASTYIVEWYAAYKKPFVSASTQNNYKTTIYKYVLPHIGDKRMVAITGRDLQLLMNALKGKGKTTITDVINLLHDVFRQAAVEGIVDRDPSLSLIKPAYGRTSRRALTDAETNAVLTLIETHSDGLLLALLYYTGMRRGEVLGLQWGDIDFEGMTISVKRDADYATNDVGTVKTESSVREIPLPPPLRKKLDEVRGIGSAFVLQGDRTGGFIPQSTYVRKWRALMVDLYALDNSVECKDFNRGVENESALLGSVLTAHYFRHNYASLLYNAGVDVLNAQRYLGHSDPATTMRTYTHLFKTTEQRDRAKVLQLFTER